ncbi:hypothetical protein Dalk_0821 [Desulfatibacillum aliphaticivorans]|uniref:Uncharacterized protein n=1 Tax=Desulfatibacillum aliphaticivorans TaxID=218208 RepID=B8FHV9_DESAL|nr:hypothetical protein [Desulfatibacillum aliphaticivorans]ACL02526.1 hypothetical protein Dalk_0821 [Desulfatibacillum aliphaticivorans]
MQYIVPNVDLKMAKKIRIVGIYFISLALTFCLVSAGSAEQTQVGFKDFIVSKAIGNSAKKDLDLELLLNELETAIERTNKFMLLTRKQADLDDIAEEQQLAKSKAYAGDAAFEGFQANADYLLQPNVTHFIFGRESKQVPNLPGSFKIRDFGELQMNVRVIDPTLGAVSRTFPLKSSFATDWRLDTKSGGKPPKGHYISMAHNIAVKLADELVDFVYPMKIIKIKGTTVWLNRGRDGGLKAGQKLNIYFPGEELIDPDTGVNLGSAEEYLGRLAITDVKPKFSLGNIDEKTDASRISSGCILRKPN